MFGKTKTASFDIITVSERISVTVIRSNRKSMALQVRADESVTARVPLWVPDAEVRRFLKQHEAWIVKKRGSVRAGSEKTREVGAPPLEQLSASERKKVREKIIARVSFYCSRMNVSVGQMSVRSQKTRWGSCSAKGNVNFNYLLAYLPEELLDYVVVHELSHRRHMDHSKEFWAEVEKYCPDYKNCRKKLKAYRIG